MLTLEGVGVYLIVLASFLQCIVSATPPPSALNQSTNTTSLTLGKPLIYFGNLDVSTSPDQGEPAQLSAFTHTWLCFISWVWLRSSVPDTSGSYCDPHEPTLQVGWAPLFNADPWGSFWPINAGEAAILYLQKLLSAMAPESREVHLQQFTVSFTGKQEGHIWMRKIQDVSPVEGTRNSEPDQNLTTPEMTADHHMQVFRRDLTGCQASRPSERLQLLVGNVQKNSELSQPHFFGAITQTLRRYVLVKKASDAIPLDFMGTGENRYIYTRYRTVVLRVFIENLRQGGSRAAWGDLEEALRRLVLLPDFVDGPYPFEVTAHAVGKGGGLGSPFVRITLGEHKLSTNETADSGEGNVENDMRNTGDEPPNATRAR